VTIETSSALRAAMISAEISTVGFTERSAGTGLAATTPKRATKKTEKSEAALKNCIVLVKLGARMNRNAGEGEVCWRGKSLLGEKRWLSRDPSYTLTWAMTTLLRGRLEDQIEEFDVVQDAREERPLA
jgi:hypothetical protein